MPSDALSDEEFIHHCRDTLEHIENPDMLRRFYDILARTICVDFDGVLHPYTRGWVGSVPDDEPPILGARDFLANITLVRKLRVVVFSTRADHPPGLEGIWGWLNKWELAEYVSEVTHLKVPAVAYVDDRAVPFDGPGTWLQTMDRVDRLLGGRSHGSGRGHESQQSKG